MTSSGWRRFEFAGCSKYFYLRVSWQNSCFPALKVTWSIILFEAGFWISWRNWKETFRWWLIPKLFVQEIS
jgi:hypothetical protein